MTSYCFLRPVHKTQSGNDSKSVSTSAPCRQKLNELVRLLVHFTGGHQLLHLMRDLRQVVAAAAQTQAGWRRRRAQARIRHRRRLTLPQEVDASSWTKENKTGVWSESVVISFSLSVTCSWETAGANVWREQRQPCFHMSGIWFQLANWLYLFDVVELTSWTKLQRSLSSC